MVRDALCPGLPAGDLGSLPGADGGKELPSLLFYTLKRCARVKEPRFCRSPVFTLKTLPGFVVSLIYCSALLTRTSCLMPRQPRGQSGCFQLGSCPLGEAPSANSLLPRRRHQSTVSLPGDKERAGGISEGHSSPAHPAVQKGDIGHMGTAGHLVLS